MIWEIKKGSPQKNEKNSKKVIGNPPEGLGVRWILQKEKYAREVRASVLMRIRRIEAGASGNVADPCL